MATTTEALNGAGRGTAIPAAKLPADPAAFVAEAERITNERDLPALDGLYADDAVFETTSDGIFERHTGGDAVVRAWKALLTAVPVQVRKSVLAVSDDSIVNDWNGTLHGRPVRGVEIWRFDSDGRIREQRLYGSVCARRSTDPRAMLRALLNQPLTAVRTKLAQRRFGARPS